MKLTGISNTLIYITAIFLSLQLCYCILLDRRLRDRIDFLNGVKCNSVKNSKIINKHIDGGRCECQESDGTLGSPIDKREIKCFEPQGFDGGTFICLQ